MLENKQNTNHDDERRKAVHEAIDILTKKQNFDDERKRALHEAYDEGLDISDFISDPNFDINRVYMLIDLVN